MLPVIFIRAFLQHTFLSSLNSGCAFYMGRPVGRSRHSDSLWAGQSGSRIPGEARFSVPSRPTPRPTQLPVQEIPGIFLG